MPKRGSQVILGLDAFYALFEALRAEGYRVVGPTIRGASISYEELISAEQLPRGWSDEQAAGKYRLKKRSDAAFFGYALGPRSWKAFLNPPSVRLWQATRKGKHFDQVPEKDESPRFAFLGVRSCELHAMALQDKVFLGDKVVDPTYQYRRQNLMVIAVNCTDAGETCFCTSMKTGPKATFGFDILLTEMVDGQNHCFLAEAGSAKGSELLARVAVREASAAERTRAEETVGQAAEQMGRSLDTDGLKELLYRNYEHPRWEDVASRCLSCGNCTMVCPTCFCTTIEDVTNIARDTAERWRKWDSCFTMDFSYIHGGSVRASAKSRYRQWLTHKLATWLDQFGTPGCVGCGRCITWCPMGIDLTEEIRAIRQSDGATHLEKGRLK